MVDGVNQAYRYIHVTDIRLKYPNKHTHAPARSDIGIIVFLSAKRAR